MNTKRYLLTTSSIFLVIAILHISRILTGWAVNLNGFQVPVWASWIALFLAIYLAKEGSRLYKKQ